MAEQFTEYLCKACGGSLRYDVSGGRMKCDYCDSEYSLEEVKAYYAAENKKNEAHRTEALRRKAPGART